VANEQNLGEQLRRARKDARLSERELARLTGLTRTALRNLEAGQSEPRLRSLSSLAIALGLRIEISPAGVVIERIEGAP
jgi:putative transcriptional regulator